MRIVGMEINNFKGIKRFTFEPNAVATEIGAANASGKSSIVSAYHWVLGLVNDAGVNPMINKKESTKETSVAIELVDTLGDVVRLEKRTKGVYENGEKTKNESTYLIGGNVVLKREYDKFIDMTFPHKALLRHDLLESVKWEELRDMIMVILGLQDKSDFADQELVKLVGSIGLANAVKGLNKRIKTQAEEIDKTAFKITVVEELRKSGDLLPTSTVAKKLGVQKIEQAKEYERLTKSVLAVEKAMFVNEKRLESEVKKLLGNGLEVILRNELLNGNIKPTCTIMYKGVEFDKLSYSYRTLAQVTLWSNLCKMVGRSYPIFIDNFESVDLSTEKKLAEFISHKQHVLLSVDDFTIKGLELIKKEDL